MKKLMLAACVSVVAFVLVPAASAGAFTGRCHFEGTAKFYKNAAYTEPVALMFEERLLQWYKFEGTKDSCEETAPPKTKFKVLKVEVKGMGKLACVLSQNTGVLAGENESGEGSLEVKEEGGAEKVTKYKVTNFSFKGAGPAVGFTAEVEEEGGAKAKGTTAGLADFAKPGNAAQKKARLEECVKSEVKELDFDAEALVKVP